MDIEVILRPDNTSLMDGVDGVVIESDPLRGLIGAVSAVYTGESTVDAGVDEAPPIGNSEEDSTHG